jgi:hypothetical protein
VLILYAAVSGVALTVALWLAGDYGRAKAYEGLKTRARAQQTNATVLRSGEKHRSIPFIVHRSRCRRRSPRDPARLNCSTEN